MNKRCFRLIFSKSLGFLIPVAEVTRAQRKAGQQTVTSPANVPLPKPFNGSLKYLVLSVLLAGMPGLTVADILPDADKPSGTSVINAANGVPVIEIANPNDKGLSHNRFNQFDVPQPGVIFNNSRVNGLSQLGGMVLLNPNLQRSATAILTEVTGNRPSAINGTLEVFGDKADLLIAKGFVIPETIRIFNDIPYRGVLRDNLVEAAQRFMSSPSDMTLAKFAASEGISRHQLSALVANDKKPKAHSLKMATYLELQRISRSGQTPAPETSAPSVKSGALPAPTDLELAMRWASAAIKDPQISFEAYAEANGTSIAALAKYVNREKKLNLNNPELAAFLGNATSGQTSVSAPPRPSVATPATGHATPVTGDDASSQHSSAAVRDAESETEGD